MDEILNLKQAVEFKNEITAYSWHVFNPFTPASLDYSDEIKIAVNNQDLYTDPSRSFIFVEGKITNSDGTAKGTAKLVPNGIAHLFEEIRYSLCNEEIAKTRNVGTVSTIKNYLLLNQMESPYMQIAGWDSPNDVIVKDGEFAALIPLKMVTGFAQDFDKIILNAKQELTLLRSRNDYDVLISTGENDKTNKVTLTRVQWHMPVVSVSDEVRLRLLNVVKNDVPLRIAFRQWEIYEQQLTESTSDTWSILTSTQTEKPRYVILALQSGRKQDVSKDGSIFDHGNISDVRLYLNSEVFPYASMHSEFAKNQYLTQYAMYARFQSTFLNTDSTEPLLSYKTFKEKAPLVVIDCSKSNESLKSGPVDVRIEWKTDGTKMSKSTIAYVIIINEKLIEYLPLSNIVKKLI